MRRLWTQVLQVGGASVLSMLASALVLFVTARALGPDGRGVYAAATSWVLLFSALGSLSLGQAVVRVVAGQQNDAWLPAILGTCLALIAGLVAINYAIAFGVFVATGGAAFRHLTPVVLCVAFAALPFVIANNNLPYVLYALDGLATANLSQAAGAVIFLGTTIMFVVVLGWGVPGALLAFVAGAATSTAISFGHMMRRARRLQVASSVARQMLSGSAQLHLNVVGTYLFTQSSVLILNQFRSLEETGYYQLAVQLLTVAMLGSTAMGTVSYALVAKAGPDEAWPQQRRLIGQGLVITSAAAIVAYMLAPWVIPRMAGVRFEPSVRIFQILLPSVIGATFSSLMASQWIGRGLFWQASTITVATGLVSVACDLIFVPRYGMRGAAVSTLVTYALSAIAHGCLMIWVDRRLRVPGSAHV